MPRRRLTCRWGRRSLASLLPPLSHPASFTTATHWCMIASAASWLSVDTAVVVARGVAASCSGCPHTRIHSRTPPRAPHPLLTASSRVRCGAVRVLQSWAAALRLAVRSGTIVRSRSAASALPSPTPPSGPPPSASTAAHTTSTPLAMLPTPPAAAPPPVKAAPKLPESLRIVGIPEEGGELRVWAEEGESVLGLLRFSWFRALPSVVR
jgi:hypothetical protein